MIKNLFFLLLCLVCFSACARLSPQQAVLNPTINTNHESKSIQGKEVYLSVNDGRARSTIGTKGYRGQGAKIIIENADDPIFFATKKQLEKMGFIVTEDQDAATLSIKLNVFYIRLANEDLLFEHSAVVETSINVEASQEKKTFAKTFRGKAEKQIFFTMNNEGNQKIIDQGISDNLSQIFNDRNFINFIIK